MKVRFTVKAADELDKILEYIRERSPSGAGRVSSRIQALLEFLSDRPEAGLKTDLKDVRIKVVAPFPYIIFYRLNADEIEIIAVRHGSRDPKTMPAKRS